jgi:hypothetical protein
MRKIVEGMALAAALGAASPEVVPKERTAQYRGVENSIPADLHTSRDFLLAIAGISKTIETLSVVKQEKELLKKRVDQLIDENERIHAALKTRGLPQAEKDKLLGELNTLIQELSTIKKFIDGKSN